MVSVSSFPFIPCPFFVPRMKHIWGHVFLAGLYGPCRKFSRTSTANCKSLKINIVDSISLTKVRVTVLMFCMRNSPAGAGTRKLRSILNFVDVILSFWARRIQPKTTYPR